MIKRPRNYKLLWGFVFLCLLVTSGSVIAAESMMVTFEVQPTAVLELPSNFVFSPVTPGQTREDVIEVLVKANVSWDLQLSGSQTAQTLDGTDVSVTSAIEVLDHQEDWRKCQSISIYIRTAQPATDSEGTIIAIPVRIQGDFNDPPGTYHTSLEFTLVPQI